MSEYKNLSRRGLIKLGNDYDRDNDNALHDYLEDHDGEYEGVRPVERVIEKTDNGIETISNSVYRIKNEGGNIIKSVASMASIVPDVISIGKSVINCFR